MRYRASILLSRVVKVLHDFVHWILLGAAVAFVIDQQRQPAHWHEAVRKSFRKNCWCTDDYMDSSEKRVPELCCVPFVDIVGAGQCAYMVGWEALFDDVVLLLAECFIRGHNPDELGEC